MSKLPPKKPTPKKSDICRRCRYPKKAHIPNGLKDFYKRPMLICPVGLGGTFKS